MKKKFLGFVLVVCLIMPLAVALAGCNTGDDNNAKIMNVELNPKLEFVLDGNSKVLSVNAINEDGNHIISLSIDAQTAKSVFEGMTAEEAISKFLELAKENGYLITGNEEEIKIEISGKADQLLNKVKEKANKFLTDNGINIDVLTEKLEKSELKEEVEKCFKELSQSEINGMSQEELVALLKESRQETKNLLTQELKDAYYNLRAEKVNVAEIEELFGLMENLSGAGEALVASYKTSIENLMAKVEELEAKYAELLLDENSAFNQAKQQYIDAKEALLEKRLELAEDGFTSAEKAILENLETAVEQAKNAMETAKELAETAIGSVRSALDLALNTVKASLETLKTTLQTLGVNLDAVANAKEQAKNEFKNFFKQHEELGGFVGLNKGHWGKGN